MSVHMDTDLENKIIVSFIFFFDYFSPKDFSKK